MKLLFTYVGWLVLLATAGCHHGAKQTNPAKLPIEVTDFRGHTVGLQEPAQRVICLIESTLSGIYMLGAQNSVIGISTNVYDAPLYGFYAPLDPRIEQRQLPAPGNWDLVSLEQVVALKPDLVIIWASQSETIQRMEAFNIPVYGVMLHSFQDVLKEMSDLGILLDKAARADSLIAFAENEISQIDECAIAGQLSAYFIWPQGVNHTSGTNSTVNDLFEMAQLHNACPLTDEHVALNLENILLWNPDLMVIWPNQRLSAPAIRETTSLASVAAIQNNRVFELPHPFLCDLWTLKMVYAARLLHHWAYPSSDTTDMTSYGNDFFNQLYSKQIDWSHER